MRNLCDYKGFDPIKPPKRPQPPWGTASARATVDRHQLAERLPSQTASAEPSGRNIHSSNNPPGAQAINTSNNHHAYQFQIPAEADDEVDKSGGLEYAAGKRIA